MRSRRTKLIPRAVEICPIGGGVLSPVLRTLLARPVCVALPDEGGARREHRRSAWRLAGALFGRCSGNSIRLTRVGARVDPSLGARRPTLVAPGSRRSAG